MKLDVKSTLLRQQTWVDKKLSYGESMKTINKTDKKGSNSMLFVYKIIHDLRHPTVATLEWLERLKQEEREELS